MNTTKIDLEMESFNEENVELALNKLGLNTCKYFIAMTKPSLLRESAIGFIAEFANRYCIVGFNNTEINLIMISRINNKKITELIKIPRNEISKITLPNIFISYMLNIKVNHSTFKFQVFKRVAGYSKIKSALESFKNIYNL